MKQILPLFLLLQSLICYAATHEIGPTKTYFSPNALYQANVLQDGDTITIDVETYTGQAALAVWQNNNLLIKGVGGQPHLVADGQYIWGKGIWVLAGDNITVENIEFSGAVVPDHNGAGIRLDGAGLTVRHCYFHDNETGILTSNPYAGDILVEFSEFSNNGYGDGFSHNLYIGHVNKLTFRFNYSHHTIVGHNLKSRANENYILYNRIMDEESGNSSRLIDLPNGGFSIVMGNLLMQGDNAPNNNLVGYGKEGLSNTSPHEFYFINNTLVNKRIASGLFLDIDEETSVVNIFNNIFAGNGATVSGPVTAMNNNFTETTIANLNFVDELNYNYQLSENSPAIDYGTMVNPVNGYSLTPDSIYEHPLSYGTRPLVNNIIDAGAYEYSQPLSIQGGAWTTLTVSPNPTTGWLHIDAKDHKVRTIFVCNNLGQLISSISNSNKVDLSNMPNGIYYLKIEMVDEKYIVKSVVKKE